MRRLLPLVLLPYLAGCAAAPECSPLPSDVCGEITAFVEGAMAELELVPGVAVAVVQGDRVVFNQGFGYRDVERRLPVTPETVFYTASLGKSFTGMTAAVLGAQGALDLDAPLSRFFPDLQMKPPLSADSVTVRDLLRHAKGFTNGGVNFVTTWVGPYAEADLLRVLSDFSTPTEGEFVYSNTNYALVGYVIERAAGRPWQEVMADLVFRPLDMNRSTAYLSRVPENEMAQPYVAHERGFERIPLLKTDRTITGAGGIFSTSHDLARYVIANLNAGRVTDRQVLPVSAVAEVQAPQVELERRFYEYNRHAYGLGFYRADYDGDQLIHHFGGFPGYRSHLSFMPEHCLGVVVLQNEGIDGNRFADVIATYIYDLILEKPDSTVRGRRRIEELRARVEEARQAREAGWEGQLMRLKATPVEPSLPLASYTGPYENERLGRLHVELWNGELRVVFGSLSGAAIPAGGDAFLIDWMPGTSPANFTFIVENGQAIELRWGARPFARVPDQRGGVRR